MKYMQNKLLYTKYDLLGSRCLECLTRLLAPQYNIICRIYPHCDLRKDGTPVTKIAPRMGMEPNSLSRILKSIEKDGLIERVPDSKDKRKVLVKLTKKGQNIRKVSIKSVFRLNNAMLEDFDPIKVKHFYEIINSVPKSTSKTLDKMLKEIKDTN